MREDFLFVEKYRPKTIDECILPDNLKNIFTTLKTKGEIINLLLTGPAGTGKTTVAKALCEELGCTYIVINGSSDNGVDMVRDQITTFASSMSTDGKTKVVILDEADYLSPNAQASLRNLIETFSKNCRFIFTCNFKNKIIPPIHSRCSVVDFTFDGDELRSMQVQITKRLFQILDNEEIKYSKEACLELVKKFSPDNRKIINEVQKYANINGEVDVGLFNVIDSAKIQSLVGFMSKGDFKSCRQFIAENPSPDTIFAELYDNIAELVHPESIPTLILILGEYQSRAPLVANQEINLAAFCVECMKSIKWRN
ncbi:MAG: AAA family ATPase [Candidatus Thiodiazotropha taylori]|uniref:DNA-directed DNA polymerase n=1 Tax=Candidatus Thiodiazotropha taylori TaxID=2792791 RepID=A0A9E4KAX7_9GAMM|nr:AAA family ATPase [Candidatus Thiodiazotropha taylori]MCW4255094.1 AAA family ATPase [Candidatus Thiodiazotropha taylori]